MCLLRAQSVTRPEGEFAPEWSTKSRLTRDKASSARRPAVTCKVGIWQGGPRQGWRRKDACTIPEGSDQKLSRWWLAWSRRASRACSRGAGPVSQRRKLLFSTPAKPTSPSFLVSQQAVRLSWPLRRWIKGKTDSGAFLNFMGRCPKRKCWAFHSSSQWLVLWMTAWNFPGKPATPLLGETMRWGQRGWNTQSIQGSCSL